jgi:hypothetical protein
MKYKVVPETTPDCDCADCRAGRHLYSLFRWRDGGWMHVAIGLQAYASPEDCMRNHSWGIEFEPDAVWEDGSPIVDPEAVPSDGGETETSGPRRMVQLDTDALARSMESFRKHLVEPAGD